MMESHNFFQIKIMQYHHMMLFQKPKQIIMHNDHRMESHNMMESHNFFQTKIMRYHHMMLCHKQKQLIMRNNHMMIFHNFEFL